MNNAFFEHAYTLEYTKRYSMSPVINQESVASHSYFVALAVMLLAEEYDFSLATAIKIAIVHDLPEIEISDVNHLVKKKYPILAKEIKETEKTIIDKFPVAVKQYCEMYDNDSVEAKIVHMADAMQCSQYARSEIKLGNKGYMDQVLQNSEHRVRNLAQELEEHLK
jgi:5'-deoxynucleotidase YfbR-like HD superfamily hydrolase|tara:strand:+ start:217 stop:714 length:498 start_codon:yes stop_codon:yes gene_type:complete